MKKYALTAFLLLSLFSCNRRGVVDNEAALLLSVENSEFNKKYNASELFDTIEMVPLETTEMSLVGNVGKIIVLDNSDSEYLL